MVEEIEDPSSQAVQQAIRIALTAAGMLAEQIARQRQEQAQRIVDAEGAESERLQARWDAQKAAAQVELTSADDRWFDRATPRDTADLWQTAQVWAGVEPEDFGAEETRIRAEIERRYDLDLVDVDRQGRELAEELRERADAQRAREREQDREASADEFSAGAVAVGAGQDAALDRAESEHREATRAGGAANDLDIQADGVEYDSDTRRAALAQRARNGGADVETVEARVTASNANGQPARQSVLRRKRIATPNRPPTHVSRDIENQR